MKTNALIMPFRTLLLALFYVCSLHPRSVGAATRTVTNLSDAGPGSLRDTIQIAASGDVIDFAVAGTLTLTSGQLGIGRDLTIVGPTAGLAISGNQNSRVFFVSGGTVVISNLALLNGRTVGTAGATGTSTSFDGSPGGAGQGGGVYNSAALTLVNCTVSSCTAVGGPGGPGWFDGFSNIGVGGTGGAGLGGGVYNEGTLTLLNCTFSSNSASGAQGAAGDQGGVGGNANGGSIANQNFLFAANCTVIGGLAAAGAGHQGGVRGGIGGSAAGGNFYHSGFANLQNTVVAGGNATLGLGAGLATNGVAIGPDVSGSISSTGHNAIGKADGSGGWIGSDIIGTTAAPFNPLLGPLQANGGPTPTMLPLLSSALIDAGDDAVLALPTSLSVDERGRPRKTGAHVDIGATESGALTLQVTTLNDSGPGSLRQAIIDASPVEGDTIGFASNVAGVITLTSGELPISKSVKIIGPGASTLGVSGNNATRVFDLLSGNVVISGLTILNGRTVGSSGLFEQSGHDGRGGGIFNQATLELSDCAINSNSVVGGQGGQTDSGFAANGGNGRGGGIENIGDLKLVRCTLAGNVAVGGLGGVATSGGSDGNGGQAYGGALYTEGTITLSNCTVNGNYATAGSGGGGTGSGNGGGIYNVQTMNVFTCTVVTNIANGSSFDFGGGIYDLGTQTAILNSTITGNQAGFGGGIYFGGSAVAVGNSILADNTATGGIGSGSDGSGSLASNDYNLIRDTNSLTLSGPIAHCIFNQSPLLGPLRDNGGATYTLAPRPGSPAIDKGYSFGVATDQRGRGRPYDFSATPNAGIGAGSDIGAVELIPPQLAVASGDGNKVIVSWAAADGGYGLESSTNLSQSASWTTVPGVPSIVGGRNTMTNSASQAQTVYRLKGS